jgi:hypothetical protein
LTWQFADSDANVDALGPPDLSFLDAAHGWSATGDGLSGGPLGISTQIADATKDFSSRVTQLRVASLQRQPAKRCGSGVARRSLSGHDWL